MQRHQGSRRFAAELDHIVGSFTAMERLSPRHAPATGLLVLKDGKILVEQYQYGRKAEDRFTSPSMAKTVVAMAVGIAVGEGLVRFVRRGSRRS